MLLGASLPDAPVFLLSVPATGLERVPHAATKLRALMKVPHVRNRYCAPNQFLTNYSIVYRNQEFVWARLFPDFPVSKQSNRYPIFGFERFKAYNTERAPGSEANEMPAWRMSNDEYYCDGKAQAAYIG